MSDIELELMAFFGTDFGASVVAELGEECVALIFIAGAKAQNGILRDDLIYFFETTNNTTKEPA